MMANARIDIFSQAEAVRSDTSHDLSRFTPKGRAEEGRPSAAELVARLPDQGKFISREAPHRTKPVRVISDRQMQFNSRVSEATRHGFEKISQRLNLPRGEVLARALRALEREIGEGTEES
jgi:hypothetical protein